MRSLTTFSFSRLPTRSKTTSQVRDPLSQFFAFVSQFGFHDFAFDELRFVEGAGFQHSRHQVANPVAWV